MSCTSLKTLRLPLQWLALLCSWCMSGSSLVVLAHPGCLRPDTAVTAPAPTEWKVGLSRKKITPQTDVWLAGYGSKRAPEGKLHDIWTKVIVLHDLAGRRCVLVTTDHQGMSKTIYQRLYARVKEQYGIEQSAFMLTFSHNHSGPCLQDDLVDYYPSDPAQQQRVQEYTLWMEDKILEAVDEAWHNLQPALLSISEGICTFAVNRRENKEDQVPEMLRTGIPLKGAVDHSVPILAIQSPSGVMLGVLFGYACHPTTLSHNHWSGDYPGYAQLAVESRYPGAQAMFFNTCGGDQNPLPRRTVALCEQYGNQLAEAVFGGLHSGLKPIRAGLVSAFEYIRLDYEEVATREKLTTIADGSQPIQSRWARRMLKKLDDGETFLPYYEYPVQVWKLGQELLLIGIGGEAVVDYSLMFKKKYPNAWVSGYTNEMAAYIPSRRVWEEGGYEGGSHLDEYGRPAWRWAGDIEERITRAVERLVQTVNEP